MVYFTFYLVSGTFYVVSNIFRKSPFTIYLILFFIYPFTEDDLAIKRRSYQFSPREISRSLCRLLS